MKQKCDFHGLCGHSTAECRRRKKLPAAAANLAEFVFTITDSGGAEEIKSHFLADTGASAHMSGFKDDFENLTPLPDGSTCTVRGPGDSSFACALAGTVRLKLATDTGNHIHAVLQDTIYVPGLKRRLFSVGAYAKNGHGACFKGGEGFLKFGGIRVDLQRHGNLFALPGKILSGKSTDRTAAAVALPTNATLDKGSRARWHERLAHTAGASVSKLAAMSKINKINLSKLCDSCSLAKSTRKSFTTRRTTRATVRGHRMFLDVGGPIEPRGLDGWRFTCILVDDKTSKKWVVHMKTKSATVDALRWFWTTICRPEHVVIRIVRTDRGGEFTGARFTQLCTELGITQEFTSPDSPEQNAPAERPWRTIGDQAQAMMLRAGLTGPEYRTLWPYAMTTAAYVGNLIPSNSIDGAIPEEAWSGEPAEYDHLRVFGCAAYVHIPKSRRRKFNPKARTCIFVGYCQDSSRRTYKFYDPETKSIIRSLHATFDETKFPALEDATRTYAPADSVSPPFFITVPAAGTPQPPDAVPEIDSVLPSPVPSHHSPDDSAKTESDEEQHSQWIPGEEWAHDNSELECISNSSVDTPPISSMDALIMDHILLSAKLADADTPQSYHEAIMGPEAEEWQRAINEELWSHGLNNTWSDECTIPKGRKVIRTKWLFKKKRENGVVVRYKARLVAQGFRQQHGVDFGETFAPVARFTTYRTVLALAAAHRWSLHQMDVDTAFLNAPMEEELYIQTPQGADGTGPRRLLKSLYGTKQAQRNWNSTMHKFMVQEGFQSSIVEPCLYTRRGEGGKLAVVVIYVDDILITGDDNPAIQKFREQISQRFKMKDLGELNWILGMAITRDKDTGDVIMSQKAYTEDILKRFKMDQCKPTTSPASSDNRRLSKSDSPTTDAERAAMRSVPYKSAVGSLMYLTVGTRPDIAAAVSEAARFMANPGRKHWEAVKQIFRYLRGTSSAVLRFRGGHDTVELVGYADADWGMCLDTRRSRTGHVFKLDKHSGAISWKSKLQPTVALSSTEAEYMAVCAATQEAVHLRRLLNDLGHHVPDGTPTMILEDNQGCIAMAKNPILHDRTKHIDIKFHFIRDKVRDNTIKLSYVQSKDQVADALTKVLKAPALARHRQSLLG
jgi:transposase InsO family protein